MNNYAFASRMQNLSGNAIREIFHLISKPNMISFAGGLPAPTTFPCQAVAEVTQKLMQEKGVEILQYGATEGYKPLLESTATFLSKMGVHVEPSQVLPVSGSMQALDLLCKAFIDKGDVILVEEPSFLGALHTMHTYEADIRGVAMDEEGVLPDELEKAIIKYKPKLIYLIPTFQNPTGRTLSLERRKAVAQIVEKHGVVLAEDDPYRDLRYRGDALPSIYSFGSGDWIVYLGSYSKLISPGLRVGMAAGPAPILRKMVIGKQASDVHSANLSQAIVDAILRTGMLPTMIEKACAGYGLQLDAMLKGFEHLPKGITHTKPEGGLFVWAALPDGADTLSLLKMAAEAGVAYVPGTHFYPQGGHENTLRLNFSNQTPDRIDEGMRILGKVFSQRL